ncbi:MAG: hypothetical protein ABIC40_04725, partial [bacterium]
HYNVLQMLEGWSCTDCVQLGKVEWSDKHTLLVDISIRHPYPANRKDLTGRDVRGVAIFPGTMNFPETLVRNAKGIDSPILASNKYVLNPDGYTTHFNRWTAKEGKGVFDYRKGKLAPDSEINIQGNLFPFKEFHTHEYMRLFYPDSTVTNTYEIGLPKNSVFSFAYSVDASWNLPMTWPVINPVTDFDISASSREAYQISMEVTDNQLTRQEGHADIIFDIFDHQFYESISTIAIEAPDLFTGRMDIDPASAAIVNGDMARYYVTIDNKDGHAKTAEGGSDIMIVVEDLANSIVGEDVKAYNIFTIPVTDPPAMWRPRNGVFLSKPFEAGAIPAGAKPDLTVISYPPDGWAIDPGNPMLVFNDDVHKRFFMYNREFTEWSDLSGYAGYPKTFIIPTRRLDSAAGGAFGVLSNSDVVVQDDYLVKHCTNAHLNGGLYAISWHPASLLDPDPHLEIAGDVSGGFGFGAGDPIYSIYLYESGTKPTYESLHRIAYPYNDPGEVLRAIVPLSDDLSGPVAPYGVSYKFFVGMGIDDEPVGEFNPYVVHVYTGENRPSGININDKEMDVYRVNFVDYLSMARIRTYDDSLLGHGVLSPLGEDSRLVDIDALPAITGDIYMGDGQYPEHNWIAVLYDYQMWSRWFIEIFDANLPGATDPSWNEPLYVIGPYQGKAFSIEVDPKSFEIYVLHDNSPLGTGELRLTCLEYY